MRTAAWIGAGLAAALLSFQGTGFCARAPKAGFELSSPDFKAEGEIPAQCSCGGKDLSPALSWSGAPKGTRSFVLFLEDPDAPLGIWIHWVVYDIPAKADGLPRALPRKRALADGTRQGLCFGVKHFERLGYWGPCPPKGPAHHYFFRLFALDRQLKLPPMADKFQVQKAMKGHVLARAVLQGLFHQ